MAILLSQDNVRHKDLLVQIAPLLVQFGVVLVHFFEINPLKTAVFTNRTN